MKEVVVDAEQSGAGSDSTVSAESSFIRLLAEAPLSVVEHEFRILEQAHRDHPESPQPEYYAAVRVRELVERRHRRERELASLYATVRSLAVLGETDEVLSIVVRHAHELMGTDVTYLSVFDESSGKLVLRATEGTVSPEFRKLDVPASTGVAGRVLERRAAHWVSNYSTATDVVHDPNFDKVMLAEGLVALLGVPLLAAGRIFGVLYAANRVEQAFSPDEVTLLSAFADYAAIALENARLYDEKRRALHELTQAYSTIETQVRDLERSTAVHEALTRIVLAGGDLGEVSDLLVETLGGGAVILDRRNQTLVARGQPFDNAEIAEITPGPGIALVEGIDESRRTGRCVVIRGKGGLTHSVTAVLAGETYLGALVWSHADPEPVDTRTLERAAQVTGLLTLMQDALTDAEERVRGELLADILSSRSPYSTELKVRARARRLDLDELNAILVIDGGDNRRGDITRRLPELAQQHGALAGEYLGMPTVLMSADDVGSAAARVHRYLKEVLNSPVLVCAASLVPPAEHPDKAFVLVKRCCALLRAMGVSDRVATTGQFGIYALLFDPDRSQDLQEFFDESIGMLTEHDARRGTDLVGTLAAYFANSGNLAKTSRDLQIHMNTLLKRMTRVSGILGSDWQETDSALRLQVAVRLHQLAQQTSAQPG